MIKERSRSGSNWTFEFTVKVSQFEKKLVKEQSCTVGNNFRTT